MSPTRRKIIYTMIVVAFGILLMTIGVVIGMNLTTPNKAPNEVEDSGDNDQGIDVGEPNPNTPTDNEGKNGGNSNDEMPIATANRTEFESSRYNIKFSYPNELGKYTHSVTPEYFYNERIDFENSELKISYVRFEGGFGPSLASGEVNTKQGYTGNYGIYSSGELGYTLYVFIPSPGSNGTTVTITSRADTLEAIEADLEIAKDILNTMEFNFSNVPMRGCETSCK